MNTFWKFARDLGLKALVVAGGMWIGWWVFGALGLATLVGECRGHKKAQEAVTAPVVAPKTKAEEKAPPKVVPNVDVQAIDPSKKERRRIAEEYHRPDLLPLAEEFERKLPSVTGGSSRVEMIHVDLMAAPRVAEIIGERTLPVLLDGGKGLLTLESDGRIELTVVANPDPFFEWESDFEVGAVYGKGFSGEARWRGWVAAEPFSVGRIHARLEVGVEGKTGQTDPYILAGGVFRGRYRD